MHLAFTRCEGPTSFKMDFGDYEISIAFDTNHDVKGNFTMCSLCVFKGTENVTSDFFTGQNERYHATEEDIVKVINQLAYI